jgi:hypothetical protein
MPVQHGPFEFVLQLLWMLGLLWIPAAYWIYSLAMTMVQADLGVMEGLFGIGAALGLAVVGVSTSQTWVAVSCSASLWLSAIGMPLVGRIMHKRAHLTIDMERMKKLCKVLTTSRRNVSALSDLGRFCAKYNLIASAIVFLEQAVSLAPQYTPDEKRQLQWLKRDFKGEPEDHPNSCPNCRELNPPDEVRCKKCGAMHLVLLAGGYWLPESAPGKLLRIWVVVLAVVFLAPAVGATIQSAVAIPLIVAIVVLAGLLLWRIVTR